ncbi:MOP flippase family protein [Spirosoma montaniterrae]|uniref:Polysaccharide biosynthesis protein n=1 Tax=Spirosoma montaniterrae TaxID=1178516 RepID=A0A1P9WZJ2_9BACT|nr:MOP flippase family protein [Spirosoma montaniterrae]AQG80774.1 polysaccharide biosynthesis protein [Spirosoma montaniterrae]
MSNTSKAMNGGKWITLSTVIFTLLQFGQVAVLARLLHPADFGIVSVSGLIIAFFGIFSNLGFANSIIYKQEDNQRVLSTLYYLNLLVGFIIFGLVHLSVPLIVLFYKEPRLEPVIRLASFYFLIVFFGQMFHFLLEKELRFRSVALIDIGGGLIGTAATVTLAYKGYHEMSLIAGSLVGQTFRTMLQIIAGWGLLKLKWVFLFRDIREHLRFGLYNIGDGLLGFVQGNSDNIFIGGLLGVEQLGYYTIAYQLAIFPITKLNPIILQVAYPILAKMKDNVASLRGSYLKILDFISYCNMPLLAGLFITADSVIPLIYGPGWEETIHLIRIFIFVSLLTCISHPMYTLAFTRGKPNLLFYLNLGTLIVKIPIVYVLGKYMGVTGAALALLLATLFNLMANFVVVHKLIGPFFSDFLRNIAKPALFSLIMVGVVLAYKVTVGNDGIGHTAVQVILGGLTYAGLTLAFKMSFAEIRNYQQAM